MSNMNKLLVIAGVSGAGKSTLEQNLIQDFPDLFHKWTQVSTRKPRPGESNGNPYVFLQPETYENIKEVLVGRLGNAANTIFKDKYGSFPDFVQGKVSTVILAEEAIIDIMNDEKIKDKCEIFIYGLDVALKDLDEKDRREGRDDSFIEKERSVLRYADATYRMSNGKYLPPSIVVDMLRLNNFIQSE